MIRLRVFGAIDLRAADGRELTAIVTQPKRLALLVYLAVTRSFHRRDALLALFWPELDAARGRAALSTALSFLRRELGGGTCEIITSRGAEEVGVDASDLSCDACMFRDAIDAGRHDEAADLYHGEFLRGFYADAGPQLDQWIDDERARLRALAASSAREHAVEAERRGELDTAVAAARRAAALSEADDRVVRDLLDLLDRIGDRAGAIDAYETFARHLATEFDAAPAVETTALISRIRSRSYTSDVAARPEVAEADSPAASSSSAVPEFSPTRRRPRWPVRLLVGSGVLAIVVAAATARSGTPFLTVDGTRVLSAAPELEVDAAISPNGQLVAYAAGTLGRMRIFVRQVDGGPTLPLSASLDGDHRWPQWSPDGTQILFVQRDSPDRGKAYVVPYTGGTPRIITEFGRRGIVTPTWSPDGKRLAVSYGDTLVIHSLETGADIPAVVGFQLYSPAFSPDGRYVAYVSGNWASHSFNRSASSIWVVDLVQGRRIRLSDSTHQNLSPAWMPDGGSLLYASDAGGARELYQQRVTDGVPVGPPRRLTTGSDAWSVTISSHGDRAAYSVYRRRSRLWLALIQPRDTVVAATLRAVTRESEWIEQVDLSPDGKWLVYDSDRSGNQEIYKTLIDGGDPVRLTRDSAPAFAPVWSPDGREIAYHSFRSGIRQIRVMSADGTDNRAATQGDTVHKVRPSWSPDGNTLAFMCRWSLNRERACVATRDVGQNWSAWRELPTGPGTARFPRWSRDGRWIAFLSGSDAAGSGLSLSLLPANGGATRRLVDTAQIGGVHYHQWGGDPSVIFVRSTYESRSPGIVRDRTGEYTFWSVPLSGGAARRLLTLAEPVGFGFATDGHRLIFPRVAEDGDIAMLSLTRSRAR